jgi:hypothetical protein
MKFYSYCANLYLKIRIHRNIINPVGKHPDHDCLTMNQSHEAITALEVTQKAPTAFSRLFLEGEVF